MARDVAENNSMLRQQSLRWSKFETATTETLREILDFLKNPRTEGASSATELNLPLRSASDLEKLEGMLKEDSVKNELVGLCI